MQLKYNHGDKILIPEISTSPLTVMSIHEGGFGRVGHHKHNYHERKILRVV